MSPEDEKLFEANRRANALRVQRALPPQAPKQSFFNKVRDQFDANTQADQYRRKQAGRPQWFGDEQRQMGVETPANNILNQVGQTLYATPKRLGEAVEEKLYGQSTINSQNSLASRQRELLGKFEAKASNSNLSLQERALQRSLADKMRRQLGITQQESKLNLATRKDKLDTKKNLAAIADAGLTIASAGVGGVALETAGSTAAKLGFKQAARGLAKPFVINTALNTAQGVTDTVANPGRGRQATGKEIATGAVLGGTIGNVVDFVFGGIPAIRSFRNYGKVLDELVEVTDTAAVKDTIKAVGSNLDDNAINDVAERIAKSTDKTEIDNILKRAAQEEAGIVAPNVTGVDTPTPVAPVAKELIDGFKQAKTPQQARDSVKVLFPELDDKTVNKVAQDLAKAQDDNTINKILQDAQASRKAVTEGVDNATPTGELAPTPEQQLAEQVPANAPIMGKQAQNVDLQANQTITPEAAPATAKAVQDANANIVVPETVTNAESLSGQFQKQAVDKDANYINYLKQVEKETGQTGLVDQFYYDSGLQRRSNSIANNQTSNSENLSQAFEGLTGDAKNQFDEYVTVRNEIANAQRGLKTKDSIQALQAREAQLAGQYGERFAALNNYYKEWAGRLREAGIIDEPTFQSFVKNDDYTHIQRVMDDLAGYSSGGGSSFSLGTTKARLKRKGSERAVQPADITALNYAQKMQSEIQRNQTASNIIDVLVEQGHAKQLPAGQATNKNAIRRIVNGKTEIFQVPRDIKEIADQITPFQLGTLGKIVAAPQRVLRAGATGLSAPFTAANYIKDQAGVAVLSKDLAATSLNPKNAAEGLFRAAQETLGGTIDDPVWQKFIAAGGDTTSYDFLRNVKDSNRMSREIRLGVKGKYANKVDSVGSVVRTLEDLNSITERATRFQSFKGVYDKVLKQTGNEAEALRQATLASWQNSVDFSRMGNTAQAINLLIPYFNAGIQGTRLLGRRLGEAPVATSMKALGFVAMPILGATLYNLADPERRAVYDNISDYEKQNNVIIVLPGAKQQADGTYDNVIKIPLQKGLVNLAQPFRMQAENFAGKADQNEISQMSQQFFGAFAGPLETGSIRGFAGGLVPQVAKPIVQQAMNKDLYTGKEIVPDYVNNATDAQGNPIPESKKAYDFTSGTARAIGGRLGVSPLRVEKLIKDTTSKTGLYTLNAADNALAKLGKIPDSQIGGLSVKDDISRRFTKAQGNYNFKKSAGGKYYDLVKDATKNLNVNEKNAYNALHPSKTNFLGEDIFDENKRLTKYARAGLYLQNPKVFAADKAIEMQMRKQGSPANPLYDLPQDQLTKSLLKDALPPGAKDDELSNLYKQEWYQDFKNKQSAYYTQLKSKLEKEGKTMPKSANPYPTTPPELQKAMDSYSALPKGTGARSGWIKANPTIWKSMTDQWGAVDAWENKERVAMGLSPLDNTQSSSGGGKFGYGKGSSSKKDKTPKTYIGTLLGDVPKISSNEIAIRTTPKRAKFKAQLPGGKGRNYKKIKLS